MCCACKVAICRSTSHALSCLNKLLCCVVHGGVDVYSCSASLQVIFFNSSGDSGLRNITSPELAQQNVITFTVTGLTINTMYEISVRAVTGAGPGENVTDSIRTEEDGE